jgi:hypothetical protein
VATWPSNQTPDQWPTAGAVPSPPAHDTTTTAAYARSTVASRAAAEFDATAPTSARLRYPTNLAWSAEQPEFASPLPIERRRPWFMHSGVLAFAAGGLVAAAAAGLFGALHGAHSASVDTSSHSAPSPAPAAAPTNPASTPATQTKPATPTHSVMGRRGSFCSTSHQTTPQHPTSSSSGQHANDQQWQSNHDSVSTPPTWNRNDYYWFTHRRDHDDSRWTRDHDSDDYSSGDHGDNSWSSRDQSSDNHSRSSDDNASK